MLFLFSFLFVLKVCQFVLLNVCSCLSQQGVEFALAIFRSKSLSLKSDRERFAQKNPIALGITCIITKKFIQIVLFDNELSKSWLKSGWINLELNGTLLKQI